MKITILRLAVALITFSIGLSALQFSLSRHRLPDQVAISVRPPSSSVIPESRDLITLEAAATVSGSAPVANFEITAAEIKENNTDLGYEIDIKYPQISNPHTRQQRRFNQYIRRIVIREANGFRAFCRSRRRTEARPLDYFLGVEYQVLYAANNLLSVRLTVESFTGYVNADWWTLPINYDLAAGRDLRLGDLFAPRSNYLARIATFSMQQLEARDLGCGSGLPNGEWALRQMREGAAARADNYSQWNVTAEGIEITFGEYQIGPGCLGLVEVMIPYGQLREIIRRNSAVAALAAAST